MINYIKINFSLLSFFLLIACQAQMNKTGKLLDKQDINISKEQPCNDFTFQEQGKEFGESFDIKKRTKNLIKDFLVQNSSIDGFPKEIQSKILSNLKYLEEVNTNDYKRVDISTRCVVNVESMLNYVIDANDLNDKIFTKEIIENKDEKKQIVSDLVSDISKNYQYNKEYNKKYSKGNTYQTQDKSKLIYYSYLIWPMDPDLQWVIYRFEHILNYDKGGWLKDVTIRFFPFKKGETTKDTWLRENVYYITFEDDTEKESLKKISSWSLKFEPYPDEGIIGQMDIEKGIFSIIKTK